MKKLVLIMAAALIACSKSDTEQETAGMTGVKSESQKMIDLQVEKINMNPTNSWQYCESKRALQYLDNLVQSAEDKNYIVAKQEQMLATLKRYVDEITEREGRVELDEHTIRETAYNKLWKEYQGWDIVTFEEANRSARNKDGIYTLSINYAATIKKGNGIFRKDDYANKRLRGIGKYILTCKSGAEAVSYSAQNIK